MSDRSSQTLVSVDAPHFNAGLIIESDICVRAAPILRYCLKREAAWCSRYFQERHWTATQRPLAVSA